MSNIEEAKKKFIEDVKLRGYDDQYIDINEEKEIFQQAIDTGLNLDSAQQSLRMLCEKFGYIIESELDKGIIELVDHSLVKGCLTKDAFFKIVETTTIKSKGILRESYIKTKVRDLIVTNEVTIKQGLFNGGSWFKTI